MANANPQVDALIAVAHAIPALHRTEHPGDSADSLGADDFLPIFIYALVNSGVEGMAAQSAVVEALCDPKKMIGEAGDVFSFSRIPSRRFLAPPIWFCYDPRAPRLSHGRSCERPCCTFFCSTAAVFKQPDSGGKAYIRV